MSIDKKHAVIFSTIALILLLVSCQTTLIRVLSKHNIEGEVKVLHHKVTHQTIIFFPMVHVGKISYYKSVSPLVDSLRKEGYCIYYENVAILHTMDSLDKEAYEKKFRKILGFSFVTSPSSLPKEYQMKGFILQDYQLMGLTPNDHVLDLNIAQIIDSLEAKYGPISLNLCDSITPLHEKYTCNGTLNHLKYDATTTFRDKHITKHILKSKGNIVLIYGKRHWYMIYPELIKHGYQLTKGNI